MCRLTSGVLVVLSVQAGELVPNPLVDVGAVTVSLTESVDVAVTDTTKVVVDREETDSEGTGDLVTPKLSPSGGGSESSLRQVGVGDREVELDVGDLELRNGGG